jgi:hypothetical protein
MFDVVARPGRATCTCPLCGTALAIAPEPTAFRTPRAEEDAAQRTVLDHLLAAHAAVVEHSTVVALGALVMAGAGTV